MSDWYLLFTREMSLTNYYLIFKGYRGMLKEFGDSFEFLMYVSKDGITRGYRQVADDARFSDRCFKALEEEGLAATVLNAIEKRFERFEKKHAFAQKLPTAENVKEAFDAYEKLWKLYIIPLYWEAALEGKPKAHITDRIHAIRELTGGTTHHKGAEGLLEELVDAIARKLAYATSLPLESFRYATPNELLGCLEGKTPPKLLLEQRKRAWVLLQRKGQFRMHAGGEAEKVAKYELGESKTTANFTSVQGTLVFGEGQITGTARVAIKRVDFANIQPGEIVVTPMTTPEVVPYLKKAAAIVTDEGGLMCHAAIIARELKVPCLVGTQEATRAFKTGDQLRVDMDGKRVDKIG